MRNQPKNFQLLLLVIKIVMEMFVINLVGSSPTKAYFLFAAGSFLRIIFLNVKDTESACFVIPFSYKAAAPFYLRVSKRLEAAKERKKQAISSKQHLYGTQAGRHHRRATRGEIGIPLERKESISTHLQTPPPLQARLVMICTRH